MNKHQVKAFTIMEVVITMLIASILMAITYRAYLIVGRSYQSFHTKNKEMAELQQLDHIIKRDFDRAEFIEKKQDSIVFKTTGFPVIYAFGPDLITRTASTADTFKVKTVNFRIAFEGQAINDLSDTEEQNLLDELSFTILYQNENVPYHYYKSYSSVNLLNYFANAVH